MEDNDIHSTEDLARYCATHNVTEDMLTGGDAYPDPDIVGEIPPLPVGGSDGTHLPRAVPPSVLYTGKGKEKLDNAAHNMAADPRPTNTAIRRRQSSSHMKLLEVTETQGKEIVSNMKKMSDMEEKKVLAVGDIAKKQLQYFKIRDSKIAITQRGLVQAVNGLSAAIIQAYSTHVVPQQDYSGGGGHGYAARTAPPYYPSWPAAGAQVQCNGVPLAVGPTDDTIHCGRKPHRSPDEDPTTVEAIFRDDADKGFAGPTDMHSTQ
jgi:hypothetical protein